jgi:hypothetical protein
MPRLKPGSAFLDALEVRDNATAVADFQGRNRDAIARSDFREEPVVVRNSASMPGLERCRGIAH